MDIQKKKSVGQALIEYLMLLGLSVLLALKMGGAFRMALAESFGVLADTISMHLTVGVCRSNCFYSDYKNGREE